MVGEWFGGLLGEAVCEGPSNGVCNVVGDGVGCRVDGVRVSSIGGDVGDNVGACSGDNVGFGNGICAAGVVGDGLGDAAADKVGDAVGNSLDGDRVGA